MIRVLIAVPTFENIHPETFAAIYNMDIPKDVTTDFRYVKGYDCAMTRNKIAQMAIDGEYDYLFTIDSDVIVPKDALYNLLERKPNVVFGAYPRKNDPTRTEIFDVRQSEYSNKARWTVDALRKFKGNRVEIRGGGAGCCLIKTSILKEVGYPQFLYVIYNQEHSFLSEDLYFCTKVRDLNYKLYVDTRVICKHIGQKIV